MSSLTQCNYCTLKHLRQRHKGTGARVLVRYNTKWGMGGANVYVLPKGVSVPEGGIKEDSNFHDTYFSCWLMEIPDSCCC